MYVLVLGTDCAPCQGGAGIDVSLYRVPSVLGKQLKLVACTFFQNSCLPLISK